MNNPMLTISKNKLNRRKQRERRAGSSLLPLFPPVQILIIAALSAIALSQVADAQCYIDPSTGQQICAKPQAASAHCRITVGEGSTGSGTLVARNDHAGLVLTCSHLFDRSAADVTVTFSDGQCFAARVLERDRAHDLAALVIHRPNIEPVEVLRDDRGAIGMLTACGFGSSGEFRCVRGSVTGRATPVGAAYPSVTIRGRVRPGDSGGGVLNTSGQLVGVVWGERDGLTYATCGRPLRELLGRVIGNEQPAESANVSGAASGSLAISNLKSQISDFDARIRKLETTKQDKGDYVLRTDLAAFARRDEVPKINSEELARRTDLANLAKRNEVQSEVKRVSSRFESIHQRVEALHEQVEKVTASRVGFFHGLSFGKLLAAALGLSGPLAFAVVVAGGLAGRRAKRAIKRGPTTAARRCPQPGSPLADSRKPTADSAQPVAVDSPPPPQRTVTETHYVPYEIDSFAKAHQWASEQVARKYPGATEMLQAQESLIKQYLASK